MHGNESTTTKAIFDLLHFLNDSKNLEAKQILEKCTLYIVPMLNPDGSELYTRVNFNEIDLNRDAQALSATVSFLSPASNKERTITESRKKGMQIIAEMNTALQKVIPNGVGRYDDGFNINCTGDTLENRGITTILFEAGHHPEDYAREITRKWMYLSLVTAINYISKNTITGKGYKNYFNIPENGKCFKDIIIRNFKINYLILDI